MRIILNSFVAVAIMAFCINSCSEEEPDNKPCDEPFSQKSVEENKEVVENSAIEMAESMDDMKDLQSVDVAVSLGERLDMDDPFENILKSTSKVSTTFKVIAGLQSGDCGLHDIFKVMKSTGELSDPETLQEAWDEMVGVYTWNSSTDMWDKTSSSDKVVFKFPSKTDKISNNAELTISNYKGIVISNPIDDEYTGDLPVSLQMGVKVDGTTIISHTFAASYNSDGIPESVAADLTLETFKFEVDLTNNNEEISANCKFIQGDKVLINTGGSIHGDFTGENIDNSTITHTDTYTWMDYVWDDDTQQYVYVEVTEIDEWEELDVGEIINSANVRFQVVNIALKGEANIKALIDEMEIIYPDDFRDDANWDDEEATRQEAAALNEYITLHAIDQAEETKIAEVEAYVVQEYDEWTEGHYNYWVDFRLKFGDESMVDLETYYEEGFEDFIDQVNSILWELNGEHDLDLDPIEY